MQGILGGANLRPSARAILLDPSSMQRPGIKSLIETKKKKKAQLTSGVMGLLTGPHQTSFSEDSSLTIRLSDGERPVLAPEYALRAPLEVIAEPVS